MLPSTRFVWHTLTLCFFGALATNVVDYNLREPLGDGDFVSSDLLAESQAERRPDYRHLTSVSAVRSERRQLKQESADGVDCGGEIIGFYDAALQQWTVPLGALSSLQLDEIVDCAEPGDSVVLELTRAEDNARIERPVTITKPISLTASFDGGPARLQLSCPDDESPVFDIRASEVSLENMEIVNCDLKKGESPITVHGRVEELRLHHFGFKNNRHFKNAATISFSNGRGSLNLTDVQFHQNGGTGSFVARLSRKTYLKDVEVSENNARLVILQFPAQADVSIVNLTANSNNVTVMQIQENSNVTVSDSTFAGNGNQGSETQGGVMHVVNSVVLVERCVFQSNFADKGGAIFAAESEVTISDATSFTDHSAHEGGACFFNGGKTLITDSTFQRNSARDDGGAIRSSSNELTLEDCRCLDNDAENSGGCLVFEDSLLNITQSEVKGNAAKLAGALKVERSTLTISGSRFIENHASNTAGCFYFDDSEGNVMGSLFKRNDAAYGGGAYVHDCHTLLFRDTEFDSNEAVQLGGAIDVDLGTIEFQSVTLENNTASLGGGLYFFNATVTGSEMRFRGNRASEGGGLMARMTNITVCPKGACQWKNTNNFATREIGDESFGIIAINNVAANGGGGLDLEETNITMSKGTFKRNRGIDGGALHVSSKDCYVTVRQSRFENNKADTMGGAVYARATTPKSIKLEFEDVAFIGNEALFGGACSLTSVSSSLTDCNFTQSTAEFNGGALFIWQSLKKVKPPETTVIRRSVLEKNVAASGAGVYARDRLHLTVESTVMRGNEARTGKGAAFCGQKIDVEIHDVNVVHNVAGTDGGGLFFNASTVRVSNASVEANEGQDGGGMMLLDIKNGTVSDSRFKNNSARGKGGGIRMDKSRVEAQSLSVTENNAMSGGGMSTNHSKILCYSCSFDKNVATENGGAIEIVSQYRPRIGAQLVNSKLEGNRAVLGGAIHFLKSHESQELCANNTDHPCGIAIIGAAFSNNIAKISGSMIHSNAKDLIFVYCSDQILDGSRFLEPSRLRQAEDAVRSDDCVEWMTSQSSVLPVSAYADKVVLEIENDCDDGDACDRYKIRWSENCMINGNQSGYCLNDFVPGRRLPPIKVIPVDAYGNENVPVHGGFKPTLQDPERNLLEGSIAASETDDKWKFVPIRTSNTLGRDEHELLHVAFSGSAGLGNVTIRVKRRECTVGEIEKDNGVLCEACDDNTYSFVPKNRSCRACPLNGNCTGDFVFPQPGYWQRSPCDERIVECLHSAACSGHVEEDDVEHSIEEKGNSTEPMHRSCALLHFTESLDKECPLKSDEEVKEFQELQCSKGYEGPLCGVCSKGYSQSGNYKCSECSPAGWYIGLVLLAMLFTVAVVTVMIRGNHVSNRELVSVDISRRNLVSSMSNEGDQAGLPPAVSLSTSEAALVATERPAEAMNTVFPKEDVPGNGLGSDRRERLAKWKICEILKVIINFLQSIAVATVINVDWAKFVRGLLQASDIASGASIEVVSNAVYCLCQEYSIRRSAWSYYIVLATPFVLVFLFALFYAVESIYRDYGFGFCVRRIPLSFAAVLFLSYLNVTRETAEVFVSVNAPSHDPSANDPEVWTRHWVPDTSLEYLSSDHKPLFTLASIVAVLYSFGFPLGSAVYLYQSYVKGRLGLDGFVYGFLGFMYRGYDHQYCYWESVIMLRKACLSMIAVFSYSLGGTTQGMLATFVLLINLFLHTWAHPYRKEFEVINSYEFDSLIVSCQTFVLSSFFVEDNASEEVRTFLSVYLGMCIIGFLLYAICELIEAIIDFLRARFESMYPTCRRRSSRQVVHLWWLHCLGEMNIVNENFVQLASVATL